jgi:SAM-dependent MidA family methyltransferase
VVLANELLDNLPFDLLEYRDGRWQEVLVGAAAAGDGLVEVLVPAPPDQAAEAGRLVSGAVDDRPGDRPAVAEGARVPLQRAATAWLRQALGVLQEGRVVVVDYADSTAGLAGRPWSHWLRTYRRHQPGGPPLEQPGSQDITCVVAVDQLAEVRRPAIDNTQAAWLRSEGIDDLAEAARAVWRARAGLGDLEAMKARSRVSEADALTDEAGLGAFRVLQWDVG